MTDDTSRLQWGVAVVAFVAAISLLGYTVLGPGLPIPTLGGDDARTDDTPNAEIEFHPNPDTMTVYYGGGGTLSSDDVYVDVESGENRTWAAYDVDLQPGQQLDAGEEVTIEQWSEGRDVTIYYEANGTQGVLASYDP